MKFYHGSSEEAIRNIMSGKFKVGKDKPDYAFALSLPDRVYLSRSVETAILHGDERVRQRVGDRIGVLEVELKDPSAIKPDELELGYLITLGYYDKKLLREAGGDPDNIDDGNYPVMPDDDQMALHEKIWRKLAEGIKHDMETMKPEDLLDEEKAAYIGIRAIQYLSVRDPEFLGRLTASMNNITTKPDNITITGAWSGTLGDFQRQMRDVEEEMRSDRFDPGMRISSRGIGRGWHFDPYRHSLAARGIPTAAFRIARQYYGSRSLRDRLADESRREPLTREIKLWSENMDDYDIEGIDNPVPEGFRIKRTVIPPRGHISERYVVDIIDDRTGDVAGYISAVNDERTLQASFMFVQNEYQKKGLSRYLMREMCNVADEMGKNMVLQISSMGDIPNDALLRYYRSFGFEPHPTDGHSYVRRPRG